LLVAAPREDLCLDFVNTLYWRGSPVPTEGLNHCGELLGWCADRLGYRLESREPALAALENWAQTEPAAAQRLFELAIALRETLHRIFSALAGQAPVAAPDLAVLNQALAEAPPRQQLTSDAAGYAWRSTPLAPSVSALLAPVLWSAADLMTRVAPERVRLCANPKCQWLFVDASKGGTRRWCDMNACGNRAKAQRHYHKRKGNTEQVSEAETVVALSPLTLGVVKGA
jgi:predicted RNA-binding Zn ribbon-like protein